MKKIISIFFTLITILAFVGCSNTAASNGHSPSKVSEASKNNSTDKQNKSKADSTKEGTQVKKMITIKIEVNNTTFTAALEDNDTVKTFVKQLPLTVEMSELNGNEKYNYLSSNLRADTPSRPNTINEGDLMLYGNNCLVLFYKNFNTSYSYVKLGHINNTKGLVEALGSGNVKVAFSVKE